MAVFQARARAVDILGDKQVADTDTAISELFKNAHDADATEAELVADTKRNSLLLWDDGHGMTYEDVTEKWLTLGTESKLGDEETPVRKTRLFERITMGEKGIGRLAIAALGNQTLMLTRIHPKLAGEKTPRWVALYLNWGVFENGHLPLHALQIPVIEFDDFSQLNDVILGLVNEFERNLTSNDPHMVKHWAKALDLRRRVLADTSLFKQNLTNIHRKWSEVLAKADERGYGTLFLIYSLKESWKLSGSESNQGQRNKAKKDSLAKTLSFFSNPMERLERDNQPDTPITFSPRVMIDDGSLLSEYQFEENDLERYDFGVVGHVDSKGVFHGEFVEQGGERRELDGLDLTAGIDPDEASACGGFSLRVYHVEGDVMNTRLEEGIWSRMQSKLATIGGVYLYRDGMRVLPYGNAGFDFLEWEEIRSRNTGRWVLSVRRAFGYISIGKVENPRLVDKSSREGLRTNKEYAFFLACLKNLFQIWMADFIQPLRKDIVAETKQKREQARLERQKKEEFEQEVKKYRKQLESEIHHRQTTQVGQTTRLELLVADRIEAFAKTELPNEYPTLSTLLQGLERAKAELDEQLRRYQHDWVIECDPRFSGDVGVTTLLELHSEWVAEHVASLQRMLERAYVESKSRIEAQLHLFLITLTNRTGNKAPEELLRDLQSFINTTKRDLDSVQAGSVRELRSEIRTLHNTYKDTLQQLGKKAAVREQEIIDAWEPQMVACFSSAQQREERVDELLQNLLLGHGDPAEIINLIHSEAAALRADLSLALDQADQTIQRARQAARVPALEALSRSVKELERSDWQLVGQLNNRLQEMSKQLEEYRHLVMTGIAAEIVNHEFDDQYRMIYNLFNTPRVKSIFKQIPELENLKILFEHLENRHRLLSPLYRRTRLTRSQINLAQLGRDVEELFEGRLDEASIEIVHAVDSDWTIRESESIIYPVFVNLINNSIYWLLNRDVKYIRLRSDMKHRTIYIEDTGPGIAADRADQIFDLFYSSRPGGRGIGLSLVKELLESRGHQITLVTDPEEKAPDYGGACFRIQFAAEAVN